MIVNRDNKSENFYTEGFGISFPTPLSIKIEKGSLYYVEKDVTTIKEYTEFEFDVELDSELPLVYDVHLLDKDVEFPVQVDRTEITEEQFAIYEGTEKLLHTILSFMVMPSVTSLEEVQINFNNVVIVDEN